jgi:hypothetical protein
MRRIAYDQPLSLHGIKSIEKQIDLLMALPHQTIRKPRHINDAVPHHASVSNLQKYPYPHLHSLIVYPIHYAELLAVFTMVEKTS